MSKAHLTHANEIFHGDAFDHKAHAHYGRKGIPIHSAYFYSFGNVAAADPDGYAEAQAVAAAGYLTLNGALAGVADVARGIVVDADGAATAVVTVTGTDFYGNTVVENITLNGTTAVAGKKAFKTVTSIYVSAACTGNVFVGTTDVLGLPFVAATKSRVVDVFFNDSKDASATIVAADATSPATATTGDVRGTIDPNTACDGLKEVAVIMIPNAANPFGVTQYAG